MLEQQVLEYLVGLRAYYPEGNKVREAVDAAALDLLSGKTRKGTLENGRAVIEELHDPAAPEAAQPRAIKILGQALGLLEARNA